MIKETNKFMESLELGIKEHEEEELIARRIRTYSLGALKAAIAIDKIHIKHNEFQQALDAMDRVFQLALELEMPHGMMLTGPTGVGKTAVFKYFRKSLPASSLFAPGEGAIGLRCPKRPRTGHFVAALLRAYKYPFAIGSAQQLYIRRSIVFEAIKQKKTRLIFIDEANLLFDTRNTKFIRDDDSEVTEFLRELIDECHIALVLAGTHDLDALSKLDSALASRLSVREALSNFLPDKNWMGILRALSIQSKEFDLSLLYQSDLGKLLHLATNGNLRTLKRLITEAVLISHDQKLMKIEQSVLVTAHQRVFGSASLQTNVFL